MTDTKKTKSKNKVRVTQSIHPAPKIVGTEATQCTKSKKEAWSQSSDISKHRQCFLKWWRTSIDPSTEVRYHPFHENSVSSKANNTGFGMRLMHYIPQCYWSRTSSFAAWQSTFWSEQY